MGGLASCGVKHMWIEICEKLFCSERRDCPPQVCGSSPCLTILGTVKLEKSNLMLDRKTMDL